MNPNIPSIELALPETGYVVKIQKWLTIGQSRELQRVMFGDASFNPAEGKMSDVKLNTFLDMQEKAAGIIIQSITKGDETISFTKEWLDSLPIKDGNLLYEKVNEVTGNASLSEDARKKS
ncbi:MAG: hypothetical protein KCHDKBKB_00602 [Elusimicrobia bacterium]|nr:hypothetical protein [Elusimicrobiota bacterium]